MDLFLVETLLDAYVAGHGLAPGAQLPAVSELARALAWREHDIDRTLRSGALKGKFRQVIAKDDALKSATTTWFVGDVACPPEPSYSFTASAAIRGSRLENRLIEAVRRPALGDLRHPFYRQEAIAAEVLGIAPGGDLLLISRFRIVDGKPGVFQRAYLHPERFPADLFTKHDLTKESLIGIYSGCGYKILSRDTRLTARLANQYESGYLSQHHGPQHLIPVIDSEQCLYAEDPAGTRFVLEYLRAAYLEDWQYDIPTRPA
jgi:DNA-binding GntR family transcriptional regulator